MSDEEQGKVIQLFDRAPARSVERQKKDWVDGLIKLVNGKNESEAKRAARELAQVFGIDAESLLIEALRSAPKVRVRAEIAEILMGFDTSDTVHALMICALRDEYTAAWQAICSLNTLSRKPVPKTRTSLLVLSLKASHKLVRCAALRCLIAIIKDKSAPSVAALALGDSSAAVRDYAKRWLIGSDREDIVPSLMRIRKIRRNNLCIQHSITEIMRERWPDIAKDLD
ncbi:MAG: hypothetical protein U9Q03_03360 [Patescibacteria group bacterium]|nr:hypothetical protein [Patescibacteria group bacterium]